MSADPLMPVAGWKVMLDGRDLTDVMQPRLVSLSLTEKRGTEADQIDILLHDTDGRLAIPPSGAVLSVAMGWRQGAGLPIGLIGKGQFKVDEIRWAGPPDQLSITARAADFTDAFRIRRERSFVGKTVREIIDAIAGDNGLSPRIDAALGNRTIPALGSGAKSDAALLKLLGARFDAVATTKAGILLFAPIGSGKSASGKRLATIDLLRTATTTIEYQRFEREPHDGVEAVWHDKTGGTRQTVKVGSGGTGKLRRLRKIHANEADARQAAEAARGKQDRAKWKATVDLALGRPDIFPETPLRLSGFKDEVDARAWTVAEARHEMDGRGGLRSQLTLDAAG